MWSCNDTLINHYKTNFYLTKIHGYSLTELDNMLPYERDIYVALLKQWIEEQEKE